MGAKPTRQLSLQPVAIGAVEEVTNLLKPSVQRVALGDLAKVQAVTSSERLSRPRKGQCGSRPGCISGKADVSGEVERQHPLVPPG